MGKPRYVLSIGLAVASLAVVLTYVLGAQVLLQTTQAEEGHNFFMSMFTPLIQAITGNHTSRSQMHGGPSSTSQNEVMNQGLIGNNILGSPKTLPAGGFAAVVVTGSIALATSAFTMSWNQRSFIVAALLAASGIMLMVLPLANMNFAIPGPIIGVFAGFVILGLGVIKGIRTARAVTASP
ncbi:MAG TPA: hypothetical protein VGQ03_07970 [Nitrososphaera sp.]|nr:hypothetical protein [Nitrososphaera sp.]